MFIRQTRTNNIATGESYFTYRLVRGERVAGKVRQITLLNLGRHFPIKQQDWPLLCSRIEQLLHPQADCSPLRCGAHLERAAQRYFGQLIARHRLRQRRIRPQSMRADLQSLPSALRRLSKSKSIPWPSRSRARSPT